MATTIPQAFLKLKSNLEITDLQETTVSTRQKSVRAALDDGLDVLDTFLTGSYSRSTMIAPLSEADIDIMAVLSASYFKQDGQASLLDTVKRVLKKTYPQTPDISRNGQAVTIAFSDFAVDVVPAFNRQGGGYLIPNSQNGTWISTDPTKHVSISAQANRAHHDMLVPLVKMLKCWNRNIGRYFRSFHLEVLTWAILDSVTISSYSSGVRYFLDKGREKVKQQNPDPAGYSGDVGYYLNSREKIEQAVSRFTTAYERALRAESYEAEGKIAAACAEWQKVFGDSFPTYR